MSEINGLITFESNECAESEIYRLFALSSTRSVSMKHLSMFFLLFRLLPTIVPSNFFSISPASLAYTSATALTSSEVYMSTYPVTRTEYFEQGSSLCRRKFGSFGAPAYNIDPPGFSSGVDARTEVSDDEMEMRYAMGLESKKGGKGKRRKEEEEVTSGNWGGRRRRTTGLGGF